MIEKRMKLSELGIILELNDERSIIRWCNKNKIPILILGKAKYVVSTFINLYFENEVLKFIQSNYPNPSEIISAIENDDKALLSELIDAPISNSMKKEFKKKGARSKASNDFLNHFKVAS